MLSASCDLHTHPTRCAIRNLYLSIPNPGSRVVQEIVRDVLIHAVPAQVHKQHGFDLSKDHQAWHVFPAYETPVRDVFLVKLVKFIVIVLHILYLFNFNTVINYLSKKDLYSRPSPSFTKGGV